ncbi:MAG: anti-sigma factor family protein [Anaerolineae bacterium]
MNCGEVQNRLDLYLEGELIEAERNTVEVHLAACLLCRRRLANLEQITALLYELPPEEPAPDLVDRVIATVEARAVRTSARRPWLRVAAMGLGMLFSALLLLALGYQTLLAWRQGGAGQFISLLLNDPELLARYPVEGLYAVLESLPVVELAVTLGLSLVILLLVEQFVRTLAGPAQPQLNGNHSERGVA